MTAKLISSPGNKKAFGVIANIPRMTKQGLRAAMFEVGNGLIKRTSTNILAGPKSGKVYVKRSRTGLRRRHKSSAPGQSHANFSGTLRRSLSYQLGGVSQIEFGYGVSTGKIAPEYAGFVEFGTRNMGSRPSLRNGLKDEQSNMVQRFQTGIKRKFK